MKVVETKNAPGAFGPYSQAYITNGFVFASGQIPVDPETGEIPEGIEAQAAQSCKNAGAMSIYTKINHSLLYSRPTRWSIETPK